MEVHSHTHTPRKKWSHYFWEFLMLFLAVFCGFLAENFREHRVEKHRAAQLAQSLYDELHDDSVNISLRVQNRLRQEASLKWLMGYFKDSSLENVSKEFSIHYLYGMHFRTPSVFEARTVVLEQLKNSGSLRYFKNQKLQTLIGDLSVAILHVNDRQAVENHVREQYMLPLTVRHYDYDFDARVTKNGTLLFGDAVTAYQESNEIIPFKFRHPGEFDREIIINILGLFGMSALRATRQQQMQRYIELNAELLKELRKVYHLKEKKR